MNALQLGEREAILEIVAEKVARQQLEIELLTVPQVCGMLNVSPAGYRKLNIPKVDLFGSERGIRHTKAAVQRFIDGRTIK